MRRVVGLVLLILLASAPGGGLRATPSPEEGAPPASPLAGRLLVAEPDLGDPNFRRTVVLVVGQDGAGTLGLVLNRPFGKAPAAELLRRLGLPDEGAAGDIALGYGGPVQREVGMVVHGPDYALPGTRPVTPELSVTGDPRVLRDMATGKGPRRALAVLGYAGWGPGQLEAELAQGAWFTIPADPGLVFAPDPAGEWAEAVRRRGVDL
jgi:putative transcriptional regulator